MNDLINQLHNIFHILGKSNLTLLKVQEKELQLNIQVSCGKGTLPVHQVHQFHKNQLVFLEKSSVHQVHI